MQALVDKHCRPCEGGTAPLPPAEAETRRRQLGSEWRLSEDGRQLSSEFRFADFFRTMSFVNALAHIAHVEDHHPDLEIGYDYCRIRYSTHSIGGLSENDFICAARIDAIDR